MEKASTKERLTRHSLIKGDCDIHSYQHGLTRLPFLTDIICGGCWCLKSHNLGGTDTSKVEPFCVGHTCILVFLCTF